MAGEKITYLGHSTFLIHSVENKTILIDPWLKDNPSCPEDLNSAEKIPSVDIMLITHGHFDHIGDAVSVGQKHAPQIIANFEIASWLEQKGLKNVHPMNKGGSLDVPNHEKIRVSQNHALHSSMIQDGDQWFNGGEATSFIVQMENGKKLFHAGDTMLFGDMKLIGEIYQPDLAMLPIGDRFTMGPAEAAIACNFLKVKKVIPMHYGTFPPLTGTPQQFLKELQGSQTEMIALKPGHSISI